MKFIHKLLLTVFVMELKVFETAAVTTYECVYNQTRRLCIFSNVLITKDAPENEYQFKVEHWAAPFFENSKIYAVDGKMISSISRQDIDLSGCGIEVVNARDDSVLNSETKLNLSNNLIESIQDSAFKSFTNLRTIDLSNNRIRTIGSKAFVSRLLSQIFLSNNLMTTISSGTFLDHRSLELMDLSNNLIETIEDHNFPHTMRGQLILQDNSLPSLKLLNLEDNRLQRIEVPAGSNIFTLKLSKNPLVTLHSDGKSSVNTLYLSELKSLKKLDLTWTKVEKVFCQMSFIEELIIGPEVVLINATNGNLKSIRLSNTTSRIETLHVSNTSITDISNIMKMNSLTDLDLSFNPIGPLNFTTFENLKLLESLNLRATNLTFLKFGMLGQQKRLKRLDISDNHLTNIDFDAFISLTALTAIFLDGNNLTRISYVSIPSDYRNLKYMGLFDNNWDCSYLASIKNYFKNFQVSLTSLNTRAGVYNDSNIDGIYCRSSKVTQKTFIPASNSRLNSTNLTDSKQKNSTISYTPHTNQMPKVTVVDNSALLIYISVILTVILVLVMIEKAMAFRNFCRSTQKVDV